MIPAVDLGQCVQKIPGTSAEDNPWKRVPVGPRLRNWNHRYPELPSPETEMCQTY